MASTVPSATIAGMCGKESCGPQRQIIGATGIGAFQPRAGRASTLGGRYASRAWRLVAATGTALALPLVASGVATAASGSLTYLKNGNAFVTPAEGGASSQVTRDGTPSDPYTSASASASGTIVALRGNTAFRLAQSGQPLAAPVGLEFQATGAGAVSADGEVLAYEGVEICGITPKPCVSTVFRSLRSGEQLIGKGLQMRNPTWAGNRVVGVVGGAVSITGPNQPQPDAWFNHLGGAVLPRTNVGTQQIESAAASPDGTRLAVTTTPGSRGERALWLLTAPALGAPPTPACLYETAPGPDTHVVWAPDGSAIASELPDGVWTMSVVDLSGTTAGCDANAATGKLVAAGGTRPSWSQAPYDPRPIAQGPPAGPTQPGSGNSKHGRKRAAPSFRVASRLRLPQVLRRGVRLSITCPRRCSASATASVNSASTRRFKLGHAATVVGRGSLGAVRPGHTGTLTVSFTRHARRQLSTARRLAIAIKVTYRMTSTTTTQSKNLEVRR
jgi:hypothetical protein